MRHLVYCYLGKVVESCRGQFKCWVLMLPDSLRRKVCLGIAVLEPCLPLRTESLADGLVVLNIIAHVEDIAIKLQG
jgi:hypothetical protein